MPNGNWIYCTDYFTIPKILSHPNVIYFDNYNSIQGKGTEASRTILSLIIHGQRDMPQHHTHTHTYTHTKPPQAGESKFESSISMKLRHLIMFSIYMYFNAYDHSGMFSINYAYKYACFT